MKKMFVLMICGLAIFSAGCSTETKIKTTVVDSSVKFTDEQIQVIEKLCDEKDDSEIWIKDTFDDSHCYHV